MTTAQAKDTRRLELEERLLKLLSGVARLQGEWGTHMVAAVLRGSERDKLLDRELDELSVYGILPDFSQHQLVAMLDDLLKAKLIRRGEARTIGLTGLGAAIMHGRKSAPDWLLDRIETAGKITQFAPGVGYSPDSPTLRKTKELLVAGCDPRIAAQKRDLEPSTIASHIIALASYGELFDLSPYLDVELVEWLQEHASDWEPGDPIKPLMEELPPEYDWYELKLHLAQIIMSKM